MKKLNQRYHPDYKSTHIIYAAKENGVIIYIGSSSLNLRGVEDNHRNWMTKKGRYGEPYEDTDFRKYLTKNSYNITFEVLVELPLRSTAYAEHVEGMLIRYYKPFLNTCVDPLLRSFIEDRCSVEWRRIAIAQYEKSE